MFKSITPVQERDACLALTFLLLLIWLFWRQPVLVYAAMLVLLAGMVWPAAMRPAAFCWFGIANVLGNFMSAILLGIVWVLLVAPVGIARRLMGRDPLKSKQWRDGGESCFVKREHTYAADDLKNPY